MDGCMHACNLFPPEKKKTLYNDSKFPKIANKVFCFFFVVFSFQMYGNCITDILVLCIITFHPSHNDHSKEIIENKMITLPHRKAKSLTEELNALS